MAERMVGKQAPRFEMEAVLASKEFGKVSLEENMKNDKWTVLFFYPMTSLLFVRQKLQQCLTAMTSSKILMQKS